MYGTPWRLTTSRMAMTLATGAGDREDDGGCSAHRDLPAARHARDSAASDRGVAAPGSRAMTGDGDAAARYLENWQDEVDSAAEYRAMAAAEPDSRLARIYANLAAMEEAHVAFWQQRLRDAG